MQTLLANVTPETLTQFGGRLHPLLLHLPIGVFAGIVLLECVALVRHKPLEQAVRATLVWMFAMSAAAAMTTGLLLSREDSYGGDALQTHKLLGIGVAVAALLMAIAASRTRTRWAYGVMLLITGTALVPAGHIGGTMTHGQDFLTAPFGNAPAMLNDAGDVAGDGAGTSSLFATTIAPIIQDKCLACHGEARHKGGLAMHTAEALLAGGDDGPVIVPGDASRSELIIRLQLPLDGEGHMPPRSKAQLDETEINAIERWIDAGAPISSDDSVLAGPSLGSLEPNSLVSGALAKPRRMPSSEALQALRVAHAHVETLDPEEGLLWVDFAGAGAISDAQAVPLLEPIQEFVAELSLSGTKVGDATTTLVSRMPHLRSLNLSRTAITPSGFAMLAGHEGIQNLSLTQTALNDSAIDVLIQMPSLRYLYIWNAGIGSEAVERLVASNSTVSIDRGETVDAEPLEVEEAIVLSGDALLPGADSTAALPPPINVNCPVSGAAVNPKFAIVHDGAIIAFCCQDCAAKFWASPSDYPLPKRASER